MSNIEFNIWINSNSGLLSTDVCNILKLSKFKLNNEEIDFYDKMNISINHLAFLGYKPITTYSNKALWVETFFEKGTNATLYDEIMQQVFGSGEYITRYFWMGTRLPTIDEIEEIDKNYQRHFP